MKHPYSCIDVLNKQKMSFLFFLIKMEDRKAKQVLSGGLVPIGGGYREEVRI
jgi:hypothetical protein